MSYEDTNCPCGDRKQNETMLCDTCMEHLKDRREMKTFHDHTESVEIRRQAAIILLALARKRKMIVRENQARQNKGEVS
jgi:hypothetical protein